MKDKLRAQDNFYDYINKKWIEENDLPEGYASWGSFEILRKKSIDDIKDLIFDMKNKSDKAIRDQKLIINLFNNYLNKDFRNKEGLKPIENIIKDIDNLKSKEEFTNFLIKMFDKYSLSFFHSKSVDADYKNSNLRALMIGSMDLGMSDRDFYETTHPRHKDIKEAYKIYIDNLLRVSKISFKTKDLFELIYNFEYEVSRSMLRREEFRVPENIYNIFTIDELNNVCSFIDWSKYLSETGYDKASKIIVTEPNYLKKLNELLATLSVEDLKDILTFKVIAGFSSLTSDELYDINFQYSTIFTGVKEKRPEIERAVEFVNNSLGELLGKEYVKKHFSEDAKNDVLDIVKKLIKVYSKRIQDLTWMTDTTKKKALEKLNNFTIKIGYPDKFENFDDIEIKTYEEGHSLIDNIQAIKKHFVKKELAEINDPVDKEKWYMYPQTVNAYYSPSSNEICFPAAILQSPFYNINESRAKNLGGIGAVIGHEVSHGFDDEGGKFDKDGNLNNWWSEEDYKQYNNLTKKLVEQYNSYKIKDSNVNGTLTLGENIGDLSGLAAALDICLEECPNDLKTFFESFAFIWRRKSTDELKNTRLLVDPHSPEEFRCNGVLVNIDKFHEVYQTKPGDGMYKSPEDRIKVW